MKAILAALALTLLAPTFAVPAPSSALRAPAGKQDKVELKFQPQKGDKVTMVKKMTMSIKAKVKAGDQDQELEFGQRGFDKKIREVLDVKDGKIVKGSIHVVEDYEEAREPGSEEFKRKDNPLHGKKITVTMKDGQPVFEGIEDPDAKMKKALRLDDEFSRTFPRKPVGVGESWTVSGKELQDVLEDEKADGKMTFKLTEVKDVDKRKCAVLDAAFEITGKTEEGIELTMKLTGEIVVRLDRGYTVTARMKGTVSMHLKNEQMEMTGDGPMTMEVAGEF